MKKASRKSDGAQAIRKAINGLSVPLFLDVNPEFGCITNPLSSVRIVDKPYRSSISAGKNSYAYDAHTYHTKVPPEGIELLINYYTNRGDVILDPFCGSGMTGLAALRNGRKVLLSDLSPAAVFIAYNFNSTIDADQYLRTVKSILEKGEALEKQLYTTHCRDCGKPTKILYMVWSYGMLCSSCNKEFVLWDVARDEQPRVRDSKIRVEFDCPFCKKALKKRELKRTRRYPVAVGYKCCAGGLKESCVPLDDYDYSLLKRIEESGIPKELWYPTAAFPDGVNTRQPKAAGIDTIDKAYTPRALWVMAFLWNEAIKLKDPRERAKILFTLTSLYQRVTLFSEFRFWGGSGNIANFNVPAIINEQNVFKTFERKAKTISWYLKEASTVDGGLQVSTQSACNLHQIPDKSVDYVFTDPPFGANINYSEMNFLWESWLQIYTNPTEEAIMNKVQNKGCLQYSELLKKSFSEIRRVLKDGGWLTVVFHNSSEKVWQALQSAILNAGFAVKGTQTFDKQHGTFKQFVSDNAVGYDLVLHCQKAIGNHKPVVTGREESLKHAAKFIRHELKQSYHKYRVCYLHVERKNEFNYRQLYANWLSTALKNSIVNINFEEFRGLTNTCLGVKEIPDAKTKNTPGF